MNHEIIDKRNREMAVFIARKLQDDPSLLAQVSTRLKQLLSRTDRSDSLKRNYSEWLQIIEKGPKAVVDVLTGSGEENDRLRQSMPCGILLSQEECLAILSKYESYRTGARSESLQGGDEGNILHRLRQSVHLSSQP